MVKYTRNQYLSSLRPLHWLLAGFHSLIMRPSVSENCVNAPMPGTAVVEAFGASEIFDQARTNR